MTRGDLVRIITTSGDLRDTPVEALCGPASPEALLAECDELNRFRGTSGSLYERVRALLFLSAIHRYFLPPKLPHNVAGLVPWEGYTHLLNRRYEEAADRFLAVQHDTGPSETISSALAAAYRGLAFQTLADQVRRSVRSIRGNQWMFRVGHADDHALRIRPELLRPADGLFPVIAEATPVRMDLTHSGWSDIFFLGMDFPEGARVLNVSIDLSVRGPAGSTGTPKPPVEAYLRIIDQPIIRLVSVDLQAQTDIDSLDDLFDFAADYLGLLKAAVIASGLIPPGLEGSGQSLRSVLARLTGSAGLGIEIVSKVNDIPKGSRLAVSTNLLACLISACMRATSQIESLTGELKESERRIVAARAILGEWLGGSGGGWQDSGGVWPGIKVIEGVVASPADVEFGVSRGCLLPQHRILDEQEVTPGTREALQKSLVLVHGGMAQDVGPILEMVTEKYLLRSKQEWQARGQAMGILDEIVGCLHRGDVRGIGAATQRNFDGPIQTIIPWAGNYYTHSLIAQVRQQWGEKFRGFWMLGGMSGGGMGFIFDPAVRSEAQTALAEIMLTTRRRLGSAVPFAMDPVVYDFAINPRGTSARLLTGVDAMLPASYYTMVVPGLLRQEARNLSLARRVELEHFGSACQTRPEMATVASSLIEYLLPRNTESSGTSVRTLDDLLTAYGFDRAQHEKIRADLRAGRIGLAQNALPQSTQIENVDPSDLTDLRGGAPDHLVRLGTDALRAGAVAVVSLSGGIGTRWTRGAGVVKALNPFCQMGGAWRTFVEIHLAKSRASARRFGAPVPHVITTSYMTHQPAQRYLEEHANHGYPGPLYLSPGRAVGLRLIPMTRDLRFLWEETPQQVLDEQKQKVRESLRSGLMQWARQMGEGSDYRDNAASQCLHPVGHWYEMPNLLLNGMLARMLDENPALRYLLLHNIDTLGATLDPGALGAHIAGGGVLTTEVIPRVIDDRGGGLARVNGSLRLVEGLALPREDMEFRLNWYNSGTMWIDIERLLTVFGLTRADLGQPDVVADAVRRMAARVPTYVTIKDVKKRWGRGQEDVFPVTQFEKLWGDMTALPEIEARFLGVPRLRGQQLKDVAQLDGWWRDGSAEWVAGLCEWE